MQRQPTKWRADYGARATKRLKEIEASIAALNAEDLLDLHDIFRNALNSPVGEMVTAEIQKRGISE